MKSDSDIKRDVEAELKWDPDIDATDIAVAAKGGVVTLTGLVLDDLAFAPFGGSASRTAQKTASPSQ